MFIFFIMGTAVANDNHNQVTFAGTHMKTSTTNNGNTNINPTFRHQSNSNFYLSKDSKNFGTGCCSILLHVNNGNDVFSFRRDSTYPANLYFVQSQWYGKDTLKEYKTASGYFFHTIIAKDGWIVSTGGPDIPYLNRQLEDLAGRTSVSGQITSNTITNAKHILWRLGMGHFLIKSPNDDVGLVLYNGGTSTHLFKMTNGQYVSVPNSPYYYRSGYRSTSNPIASAINLAITDGWGVNRRNIITYHITQEEDLINYATSINVYASRTRMADYIYFGGGIISGYSLPRAPGYKALGRVLLKNKETLPSGLSGSLYSLRK
jgi:hypothetical protein